MEVRLMMVTTSQEKRQARILITGSWLDRFGFLPEMLVTVFYQDGVLTMEAFGIGLDSYRHIVGQVRKQRGQLLQVRHVYDWSCKKTESHLELEGTWLEKQGFCVGDILLAQFNQGTIRMKRLQLQALGFDSQPDVSYRTMRVQDNGRNTPQIALNGEYLSNYGFFAGQTASVTYEPDGITFQPVDESLITRNHGQPAKINILSKRNAPRLCLNGAWLRKLGYEPGDFLILQCQPGQLRIRLLEHHHLHF